MQSGNWSVLKKITRLLGKLARKIGVKIAGFVRWYLKTMTTFNTYKHPLTWEQDMIRVWLLVATIWICYLLICLL